MKVFTGIEKKKLKKTKFSVWIKKFFCLPFSNLLKVIKREVVTKFLDTCGNGNWWSFILTRDIFLSKNSLN